MPWAATMTSPAAHLVTILAILGFGVSCICFRYPRSGLVGWYMIVVGLFLSVMWGPV